MYVTGNVIKNLREKKHLTQKELAEKLLLSDKTISKWETDRGLPDISLISPLATILGVSVAELLMGEQIENGNLSANMKKTQFYVCPVCGNVIQAIGCGAYNCCGILLPPAEVEEPDDMHLIQVETIDHEYYIHLEHTMTKDHYISFIAYVTSNRVEVVKLYPEQDAECRFAKKGHGFLYLYCNQHGLYRIMV